MRPLRIHLLSSWIRDPSRGTGTAVSVQSLLRALEAAGHEVLAPTAPAALPFPASFLLYNLFLPRWTSDGAADLTLAVDADGCLLRNPPRPYVVLLKGIAAAEADLERGVARASLRALARAEGWNARRADGVVVPSDYSAGEAKLRYGVHPDRIIVLPEGIDGDAWARLRNQPPATRAGLPTVLTVARQYRRKNTETLLRALPALARRVPDVRLRVVGGGPRLPHLQRLAAELAVAERVTFTGPVPDETVRREYFRAWCFCLPSLQEAFGIASLEAMAAGLPVVAARTAATPEVVPEGVAGLLVDPYDTDALAAALVRILLDRELRRRFAEAGVRRAAALDMAAQARELIDTLAPLLPTPELVERAA